MMIQVMVLHPHPELEDVLDVHPHPVAVKSLMAISYEGRLVCVSMGDRKFLKTGQNVILENILIFAYDIDILSVQGWQGERK